MEKSLKGLNLIIAGLFVSVLTMFVVQDRFTEWKEIRTTKGLSADVVEKNLTCLAINIYKEAGYEPFEGKVAVAQVTLNRTQHPQFPSEICDVVYQKNKFTGKVVCQFSWYCDSVHRNRPVNKEMYDESYRVAKMVYLEGFKLESLEGAIYYHADYISPNWRKPKITKIGQHIFYRG